MGNAKGDTAERGLATLLWDRGYSVLRAPGSGSIGRPSPDVFAVKEQVLDTRNPGPCRRVSDACAIELKARDSGTANFDREEIVDLREFAARAGAEAWVAVKPDLRSHSQWYLKEASALHETPEGNYSIRKVDLDECPGLEEVFG